MNSKIAKKIRLYCKLRGAPVDGAKRAFKKASEDQRRSYVIEMDKKIQELQSGMNQEHMITAQS